MNNNKYVIIDFNTMESMKDFEGNIKYYDTETDARLDCGMYELNEAWIVKLVHQHVENSHAVKHRRSSFGFDYSIGNSIVQNPNKPYEEAKRKLNELTDDEVLKICKVLNGKVENTTIERDSIFIGVKYFDEDSEAKIEVLIRTDYQYRSSEKDLITKTVSYFKKNDFGSDKKELEYLNSLILSKEKGDIKYGYGQEIEIWQRKCSIESKQKKNDYCSKSSNHQVSQGRLLEIIEYLQSINVEL